MSSDHVHTPHRSHPTSSRSGSSKRREIRAVLFDADGVLIDSYHANFRFYQNLMAHAGYPKPTEETFRGTFHMTMYETIAYLTGADSAEVERIWHLYPSADLVYPTELVTNPPGHQAVIRSLQRDYTLAIVTSRIKIGITQLPALDAVRDCFRTVVCYEDTQEHKPHPAPLLLAADRLSLNPAQAVYIGDSDSDVQAARAAGMPVIYFGKEAHPDADMSVAEFGKLTSAIASFSQRNRRRTVPKRKI